MHRFLLQEQLNREHPIGKVPPWTNKNKVGRSFFSCHFLRLLLGRQAKSEEGKEYEEDCEKIVKKCALSSIASKQQTYFLLTTMPTALLTIMYLKAAIRVSLGYKTFECTKQMTQEFDYTIQQVMIRS